jgi:hypothetical protein
MKNKRSSVGQWINGSTDFTYNWQLYIKNVHSMNSNITRLVRWLQRSAEPADDILWDQQKDIVVVFFGLDVFCLFEARAPGFDAAYAFTAASVLQQERFSVQFVALKPQKGRKHHAQNSMTILLCWSNNTSSLAMPLLSCPVHMSVYRTVPRWLHKSLFNSPPPPGSVDGASYQRLS